VVIRLCTLVCRWNRIIEQRILHWQRKTDKLKEKPITSQISPRQIPHSLAWGRAQASAFRGWCLTFRAKALQSLIPYNFEMYNSLWMVNRWRSGRTPSLPKLGNTSKVTGQKTSVVTAGGELVEIGTSYLQKTSL